MGAISFISREHRLVLDGPCWPEDAEGIAAAIASMAAPSRTLTVDLTRSPWLPEEVANRVATACAAARRSGCRVQVWTDASVASTPAPRAEGETPTAVTAS